MLAKLSLRNIRHSLRDYAVYFFTLIIGVTIFYTFNAIDTQTSMLASSAASSSSFDLLNNALGAVSVFVSVVLGLLIVYASRFLMKRRNKEFALYLLLGMKKRAVSTLLLLETLLIGIGSLGVGLLLGCFLSQLMSALVANLFGADMSTYRFVISFTAIAKTIWHFAFMYLVVILLNTRSVGRMQLIDLMNSGDESEPIKLKNPILCIIVFIIAAAILGIAYYVTSNVAMLNSASAIGICIMMGCVGTFLLFWSISGMLMRVLQRMKPLYFKDLNCFTFRQVSSKINTVVFSMSCICIMLFFTICTLSSAFSLRNDLYGCMPEDVSMTYGSTYSAGTPMPITLPELYAKHGQDVTEHLSSYSECLMYDGNEAHIDTDAAEKNGVGSLELSYLSSWFPSIVSLSDYNALRQFYGESPLELGDDEWVYVCGDPNTSDLYERMGKGNVTIEVFGATLKPAETCVVNNPSRMSTVGSFGALIVPDALVQGQQPVCDNIVGIYQASTDEERKALDEQVTSTFHSIETAEEEQDENASLMRIQTKTEALEGLISGTATLTLVCLYIGTVFLVASGALLALRGLSDSIDSAPRYDILRKIGASERSINRSLLHQMAVLFLLPLILACFHSIFGMQFMMFFLRFENPEINIAGSVIGTLVIILAIYGGYFLTTYLGSKRIIKGN